MHIYMRLYIAEISIPTHINGGGGRGDMGVNDNYSPVLTPT